MLNPRRASLRLAFAVVGAGVASAACGLLDLTQINISTIPFQIPSQTFTVSTMDSRWQAPPAGSIPDVSCGPTGVTMDCCAIPQGVATVDCSTYMLSCSDGRCAYLMPYAVVQPVDLSGASSEFGGKVPSQVTLTSLTYTVNNQLNLALPPVDLYLAPSSVTSVSDGRAQKLVTLPAQPAGAQMTSTIPLDAAGQMIFANFAHDVKTPFNVIASTTLVLTGNSATPTGMATFTIGGQAEFKL